MDRYSVTAEALQKQSQVAEWFKNRQVKVQKEALNMYKCIDPSRSDKVAPFLLEIGHGDKTYSLWRLTGKSTILKDPDFDSLFFPFSTVEIDGVSIEAGQYVRFSKDITLTATVDCLLVGVPGAGND